MRRSLLRAITSALIATLSVVSFHSPSNAKPSRPVDSVQRAHALLERDQDRAAVECLNRILYKQPKNALAYSERSMAHGKLNEFEAAKTDANRAVALAPANATVYANRAAIDIVENQYEKALADCNKAIALNPKLALAYGMKALVYERQKDYTNSVLEHSKAIAIEPNTARYYVWRASAYRSLKQYAKALQDCTKALSLNPRRSRPHIERGFNYLCLGQYQKAVDDYTTAIRIKPNLAEAYSLRARAYELLGEPYKRIEDLHKSIELDPKAVSPRENLAEVYYVSGQLQKTLSEANAIIALDPSSGCALSSGASAYYELGMYEPALELQTKLLAVGKGAADEWRNRANIYDKIGQYDLANADRKKAATLASLNLQRTMNGCSPLNDFVNPSPEMPQITIRKQLDNNPVVLPFNYDVGRHMGISVQLNGHDLQFMLDTGCGHSTLWKHANTGIGELDKGETTGTKANGKSFSFGFFRAKDFSLGHLKLVNVAMNVDDGLVRHKTLSGFLGGNILENFVVTIDYVKKQVVFSNSTIASKSARAIVVPLFIRNHAPHCIVKLNGKLDVRALLDTGCPGSLAPDSLVKPVLPKSLEFKESTGGPWLGKLRSESVRFDDICVVGRQFKSPVFDVFIAAEAHQASSEIVLGNDFLSQFRTVSFDYPGRQLILEPGDTLKTANSVNREAMYFLAHHQEQNALDAFERVMRLDPSLAAWCHYGRGRAFSSMHQPHKAIKEFTQAAVLADDLAERSYFYRGFEFVELDNYPQAIEDWSEALKRDPKDAWNYNVRAWGYWKIGNYQLSIRDNTTAISLDPEFIAAYKDRAFAYEKIGQISLALQDRAMIKALSLRSINANPAK